MPTSLSRRGRSRQTGIFLGVPYGGVTVYLFGVSQAGKTMSQIVGL